MVLGMGQWPFMINKEMDESADRQGLSHWSCVSPKSNTWWVRKDGHQCDPFEYANTWPEGLRAFDKQFPIEE